MRYALNLSEEGRILSATFEKYAFANNVIVDYLPEGDISDYCYINGEYIYDPIPKPAQPEPEPTTDEILNALLGVNE